ncbi:nucleotidyltransferase domain-containing protein [Synechococcus sp. CC9311]|uniref:nucleotidyltransferase domain-containing protein n=1 Tax=Synechococcus sp. (strain CC9311) TaxID=64471 RepID=UPI0000DDA9B8|nr:nucleotidyltransferase domain-containing protein [Synechococcus sp. CC9311]ABI45659.1 nucleotidyltransferase domain protein [Synechococcus sp. CC9311]
MDATSSEKAQTVVIPGISGPQQQRLLDVLIKQADVDAMWLFGSRAMGQERPGSDIDLCVDAARLTHLERLRLMADIDELLLPWTVDLALRHELPPDLVSHVERVGRCLWTRTK